MPRFKIRNYPYAIAFDGTKKVNLTTMGNLGSSLSGAFSFGVWFKTNERTAPMYILGSIQSAGGNFILIGMNRNSTNIGKFTFQMRDNPGNGIGIEGGSFLNDGRWHHAVVTKDAQNTVAGMKIYIDGALITTTTITSQPFATPINFDRGLALGANSAVGSANFFKGLLTRPFIYQRELTLQEIKDWYFEDKLPSNEFAGYLSNEGVLTTLADTKSTYNGTLDNASMWNTYTPMKSRSVA